NGGGLAHCNSSDISISNEPLGKSGSGIPAYGVTIINTSQCRIGKIHVTCGWFASAKVILPKKFRRLAYNDCLVNDGKPMSPGQLINFKYFNTYSYPISVSSFVCSCSS
ncbi:TPD1 protein homolog 1, partial [Linum perenne]